ncbi:MAG: hypothetical protein ABSA02_11650 [Trebonia sp.]|jgi:hypothetical protein
MTDPASTSSNFADGNAHGFVQAQDIYGDVTNTDNSTTVVHGDVRFEVPPGSTAADKYRAGVYNLNSGVAPEARSLIWEAMAEGHRTSEARFLWLIAMLSGRTVRQFSDDEISQLATAAKQQPATATDSWEDGAQLIFQLLESVDLLPSSPRPDIALVIKKFGTLSKAQRDLLLPHLELFLEGPLKDDIWRQEWSNAVSGQSAGGRKNRAWMFFQPDPAKPRVRPAQPIATTSRQWLAAWTCTGILVVAVGYFGWELIWHGVLLGMLAYVGALAGGAVAVVAGLELRFLAERRRQEEERLIAPRRTAPAPPRGGFAANVDALFNRYVPRCVPDKDERAAWDAATTGIRKFDRDEIVTVYRETRIPADQVAWLVRYRLRQTRDRWRSGEMYQFRTDLRPKPGTTTACWAGTVIAILGGIYAIVLLRAYPLADTVSVIVALPGGVWAWRTWLSIDLERRRFGADSKEADRRLEGTGKEFQRWSARLEPRPTDAEMAAWLDCDRTVLLGKAIDHYKLARHQVITHAFLEAPGPRTKRARVRNGPMRYSRYSLIAFLLTSDGVRQMSADLRFLLGEVIAGDRLNYRYDAVASAHVSLTPRPSSRSRIQQKFKLTLVNGDPISVIVSDLDPEDFEQGETEQSLKRATLDAASVPNTLHVLEGIAAEGKAWLQEQRTVHRRTVG